MTYTVAKEKLHDYLEQASQEKIMAMYTLLAEEIEHSDFEYDDETLNMLEQRSNDAFAGKSKTYTVQESIENINMHRKNNGL